MSSGERYQHAEDGSDGGVVNTHPMASSSVCIVPLKVSYPAGVFLLPSSAGEGWLLQFGEDEDERDS